MKMDILYLTIYVHSECNKVKDMIFLQMGFVKHHNSIIRNGINDSQNVKPTFMEISQVGTFIILFQGMHFGRQPSPEIQMGNEPRSARWGGGAGCWVAQWEPHTRRIPSNNLTWLLARA